MFKKLKLRETRDNIKNAGKDYERFKETLYNNLKRVCGKKIKDFSNLKNTTDELPEIAEINRMIEETDESLKQLNDEFQSKIKIFQNEIELLKTNFTKQKGLTPEQKLRAIEEFNAEKEKRTKQFQSAKFVVGKMKIQLNKTKKLYEKQKTKFIVQIKKKIEKEVKTKTTELKKTKKLKKRVEDLNVANGAEELKNLVMEKQGIIEEEIKKYYIENKDVEIANREKEEKKKEEKEMKEQEAKRKKEEKEIKEQETKRKKEEEKIRKEEEKRKKDEENKSKKEEGQRKKDEEQRKKNEEKEEAKRKKEEEKRKKDEEKEEAKRKKEEEKQTRKLEKKTKNNKTKKNGST
jgi:nucleolar protein 8